MDDEIWILLVVPSLALVAFTDSFTKLSRRLATRIGGVSEAVAHLAVLLVALALLVIVLTNLLEDVRTAFWIKDYLRAEDHMVKDEIQRILIIGDVGLIAISLVASVILSMRKRLNIVLCVLVAAIGNVGSVAWMIAARATAKNRY